MLAAPTEMGEEGRKKTNSCRPGHTRTLLSTNTGRVPFNAGTNIIGYSQKKIASQTRTKPNKQR